MLKLYLKSQYRRGFTHFIVGVALLFMCSALAIAHGMSEAEKQSIVDGGNWSYLYLGATHMLSGYDHLAFVFGIIFFLTSFRDIAKYVTAFTIGHSVTLIYATFNAIQLNYFLIDAVIALSVCYIAFANLDGFRKYLGMNPPNMLLMITGLGLIHGFGLSTRLQALPLSQDHLLMNIISFNVGIELGQIGALIVMLLLITAWRKTHFFQTFSMVTNFSLIVLGSLLFLMQMHGYEHTANASEYDASDNESEVTRDSSLFSDKQTSPWKDEEMITIPARGEKEYKLYIRKYATFAYAWQTNGEALFFDFHGEPINDTSGYFKSFGQGVDSKDSGILTASFSGTHGWYWKNSSNKPVVITLKTKGDYQVTDEIIKQTDTKPDNNKPENIERRGVHDSIF